ncbi:MAG: methyltransferase [Ruminococcus sp.]|nr:methyltransferase [Ruminococcus sp.]
MDHYFTNNSNLKSELRIIKYTYGNSSYEFLSDNGVFSKDKIDYGSKLLVETFLNNFNNKKINNFLDVGCGYGFISIIIAGALNIEGMGIDINNRALKLAGENARKNKVKVTFKESNIYENVNDRFDLIITNPPIRAGKSVVLAILKEAKDYLSPEGELWFVIRKNQGSDSIVKALKDIYNIEVIEKKKGFGIFLAKRN